MLMLSTLNLKYMLLKMLSSNFLQLLFEIYIGIEIYFKYVLWWKGIALWYNKLKYTSWFEYNVKSW